MTEVQENAPHMESEMNAASVQPVESPKDLSQPMKIETNNHVPSSNGHTEEGITLFWKNINLKTPVTSSTESELSRLKTQNPNISVVNGKSMKTVIDNFTGVARPKELIGLLGPSGCGKTVLLDIFSDRLKAPVGSIYERNVYINNNVPLTRSLFGKKCAYVMQDDVLLDTLTPLECMKFSANLRLSCSQEEKDKAALKVIEDLRLQTCMNTRVGSVLKKGISGGERRRSSIGVEIVTDPSLIILDGNRVYNS